MSACLNCKGERIIRGTLFGTGMSLITRSTLQNLIFRPKHLRLFSFSTFGGVNVNRHGFACLDCGLVWSATDAAELQNFVARYCDEPNLKMPPLVTAAGAAEATRPKRTKQVVGMILGSLIYFGSPIWGGLVLAKWQFPFDAAGNHVIRTIVYGLNTIAISGLLILIISIVSFIRAGRTKCS